LRESFSAAFISFGAKDLSSDSVAAWDGTPMQSAPTTFHRAPKTGAAASYRKKLLELGCTFAD
jgi:hypothetical protein